MLQLPQPGWVRGRSVPIALVLAALALPGIPVGYPAAVQDAGRPALCAPAPCLARTIPVGHMPVALAVDTRTQHAFVRNGDGTVSVLDLTRGTLLRTVVVSKPDANANGLAVDEQTGRVFVTSGSAVSVLDATSGSLLRTVRLGAFPVDIGGDTTANRVFVPTGSGTVSLLDARSGALLRTVHTGGAPNALPGLAVDERTRRVFVAATNFVKVLDASTGALLRTVAGVTPGGAYIAVDAATSRVFLANFVGSAVSIFDARDGTLLRSLGLRQGYDNSDVGPLVVDERAGRVFVVGDNVNVLDARSGAVLVTRRLPRTGPGRGVAHISAVDEQTGRLFVPISYSMHDQGPLPGTVSVVDPATARVLKTVPVGVLPKSAVVDARARQVLVLNYGNTLGNIYATGSVNVLRLR
jgi:DNA-binding beta-propeller fold protein YncE